MIPYEHDAIHSSKIAEKLIVDWYGHHISSNEFKSVYINEILNQYGKIDYEVMVEYQAKSELYSTQFAQNTVKFGKYPSKRKALKIVSQIEEHLGKKGNAKHDD